MKKQRTQITPELKARVKGLKQKARKILAKTCIVQFRLDEEIFQALARVCEQERKPIGAVVRAWVTEKVLGRSQKRDETSIKIASLQQQIDQIRQQISR